MTRTAAATIATCLLAALAPAVAAKDAPAVRMLADNTEHRFAAVDDMPSNGVLRLLAISSWRWDNNEGRKVSVRDATQRIVAVFVEGSPQRAAGLSHAVIEREAACPGTTLARLSYVVYADDGKVSQRAAALPDDAAPLLKDRWIEGNWGNTCAPPVAHPAPMAGVRPSLLNSQRMPIGNGVDGAVKVARALEAAIATARALPEDGKFAAIDPQAQPGVALFDHATLTNADGSKRISWLAVGLPELGRGSAYVRASYDVDCDAKTARPHLVAQFDGDGRLVKVFPAQENNGPFSYWGDLGKDLAAACESDGPGLFDRTYKTFTAALAAAREKFSQQ